MSLAPLAALHLSPVALAVAVGVALVAALLAAEEAELRRGASPAGDPGA